jgi:hypothetical protein
MSSSRQNSLIFKRMLRMSLDKFTSDQRRDSLPFP